MIDLRISSYDEKRWSWSHFVQTLFNRARKKVIERNHNYYHIKHLHNICKFYAIFVLTLIVLNWVECKIKKLQKSIQ